MKKFAPIAAVALLGMMFTSCKKDFTCTCKDSAGTTVGTPTKYTNVKKKDAKTLCDLANTGMAANGGSCSLD